MMVQIVKIKESYGWLAGCVSDDIFQASDFGFQALSVSA